MSDKGKARFSLEVPLDASEIEDFKPEKKLKVVAEARDGSRETETVQLNKQGQGKVKLTFDRPVSLRMAIGPADASDEELLGLQTINIEVSAQQWGNKGELVLPAVKISPFYWHWWLRWCRTFTIRGRVVCPDGSPVPGAKVCAFDVDYWWWWCSRQEIACDETDATGAFEIRFRWCCGWWPWWWWRRRNWLLDPALLERLMPVVQRDLGIVDPAPPSPRPNFALFDRILAEDNVLTREPAERVNPAALDKLRAELLPRLPAAPEIAGLRIWPWWPWHPWWDCTPDIIFNVTQRCLGEEKIIVQEGCLDTRWNVPTTLDVTLVASDEACCIPQCTDPQDCPEGNCALITHACNDPIFTIGGNPGAAAGSIGYRNPGIAATHGDRPYAGVVPVHGVFGDLVVVDYYEFEWSDNSGITWNTLPPAAAGGFSRVYWGPQLGGGPVGFHAVPFSFSTIDGQRVVESREHFESNNDPLSWGITRFWVTNVNLLMRWLTEGIFNDGTYQLRIVSWQEMGGNLQNRTVLPLCNTTQDNGLALTLDNRIVGPGSGHPTAPDHPCGSGTVHLCTTEPDTDIIAVAIVHPDNSTSDVGACGNQSIGTADTLRVDFMAHDPDGHLAYYSLVATYGENLANNLLALPGAVLTPLPGGPVPPAVQVGPTYGLARSAQGAVAPTWHGGALRLEVPAHQAFPVTCCYQLELRAFKRTIANCAENYPHRNRSEFSFGITV